MKGRLEREIRLLPHVLACSFSDRDVFVLVTPAADANAVERVVSRLLADAGDPSQLHVIGGPERTAAAAVRPRALVLRPRVGMATGIALTGLLAASSLIGGLRIERDRPGDAQRALPPVTGSAPSEISILRPEPPPGTVVLDGRTRAPRGARGLVDVALGPTSPPLGLPSVGTIDVPVERNLGSPNASEEPAGAKPDGRQETRSCDGPPDRGAPRERAERRKGDGPPAWSRSVLVEPHDLCEHGR